MDTTLYSVISKHLHGKLRWFIAFRGVPQYATCYATAAEAEAACAAAVATRSE